MVVTRWDAVDDHVGDNGVYICIHQYCKLVDVGSSFLGDLRANNENTMLVLCPWPNVPSHQACGSNHTDGSNEVPCSVHKLRWKLGLADWHDKLEFSDSKEHWGK